MYLRGSKLNMNRRRRRSNPLVIIVLGLLVSGMIYVNEVIVPQTPPLFLPTPTPTRAPESYITEAEQLASQGKLSQAISAYKQSIQADPNNPSNYVALSRLQIYLGLYQDAIDNAGNALLQNPNNAQAIALRGYALGLQGQYLDAETALDEAIRIDPNNPIPYAYKAEILANKSTTNQGDLNTQDEAIALSRKAVQMGGNLLEVHRARGIVLEITSNYEEAVQELEAAVSLNPNIADLHIILGRNYRFLGRVNDAIREFNNAIPLNPTDPTPYIYLSRTHAQEGEYPKAIQYGEQAISLDPTNTFLYGNIGVMYYRFRDYPRAIEYLRIAVRGGTTADGTTLEGIPLDYYPVSEYYYTYGLALSRQGVCGEALEISQLLLNGVSNEEVSVYNAQEIITICQQVASGGTPTPEGPTPTP